MVRKSGVLVAVWLAQSVPFLMLLPLILLGVNPNHGYFEYFTESDFWTVAGVGAGAVAVTQALFLWQIRKPIHLRAGRSVWMSVVVGAAMCATLSAAVMLALAGAVGMISDIDLDGRLGEQVLWGIALAAGVAWLVWTPILSAFCDRGARETALARLSARLLLGTVVEALAIIPIDVLVRRRTNCYCGEPTFGALALCLGVGWFALGPAVFLPLISRRRKRWYAGHCDACGYDMKGCMSAARCPECGAGWRATVER